MNPLNPLAPTVSIESLVIGRTNGFEKQFLRPYKTKITGHNLSALTEAIQENGKLSEFAFSNISNDQLLFPSSEPETEALIPGGWESKRCSFMILVDVKSPIGARVTEVISGYTDFDGVSEDGNIDPNMKFYINTIGYIRKFQENTPFGVVHHERMEDVSHYLSSHKVSHDIRDDLISLRPMDIYNGIMTETYAHLSDVFDIRNRVHPIAGLTSSRKNTIAADYLSRTINATVEACDSTGFMDFGEQDTNVKARDIVSERSSKTNQFICKLKEVQNQLVNYFTIGDLKLLNGNEDYPITVVEPHEGILRSDSGQDWNNDDPETSFAYALGVGVSSLMLNCGLVASKFVFDNNCEDEPKLNITHLSSLTNGDVGKLQNQFRTRLIHELFNVLTQNNRISCFVEVTANAFNETQINIRLMGKPAVEFFVPNFADSLFSPIMTNSHEHHIALISDMGFILNSVYSASDSVQTGTFGGI